jgi:hypothetical protein
VFLQTRSLFGVLVLGFSLLTLPAGADDEIDPLAPLYGSFQLTPCVLTKKGPFTQGDVVVVKCGLKNASDKSIDVPLNVKFSRPMHLVGSYQFWLDRLEEDGDASAIPKVVAGGKSRTGAGGAIIVTGNVVRKGQVTDFDIGGKVNTAGLLPGKYRISVDYKSLDPTSRVLQSEFVDFELKAK